MATKWIKVGQRAPERSMIPDSLGVQVMIWPHYIEEGSTPYPVAFYGCRQTDEPNFYLHGRVIFPTHWAPLPAGPR